MKKQETKKKNFLEIKKLFPQIKENVSLKNYSTFKIGGRARYLLEVQTKQEIIQAIRAMKKLNLPFFVIGQGSNVLFSDKNFQGVVIKIKNSEIKIYNQNIEVGAGTPLSLLSLRAKEKGLSGLEWAIGIPGTVGGAIWGNASAFGKAMGDLIKWVEVFDASEEKIKKLPRSKCRFQYKNSIFKQKNNLIILASKISLKKEKRETIEKRMKEFLKIRKERQPLNFPSAGCIFKNYKFPKEKKNFFLKKFPQIEEFIKKGEIPAGYLIEKASCRGKKIGQAVVSEKHANFILNLGKAKAEDIKKLICYIKQKVKKIFDIELEEEIIIFSY